MSTETQELILRQQDSFLKIKQICTNFKKDSASRKTLEYLERRLSDLKSQWQEFQRNHEVLLQLEDRNIDYFNDNIFERTKALCEETENEILNLQNEIVMSFRTPSTSQGVQKNPEKRDLKESTASSMTNKRNELLRYQQCNFKMLRRALSKYETVTITEKWELEDALGDIKSKWQSIEKTHFELDYLSPETDYFYEHEYSELEKSYDNIKKQLNHKIWNNVHYEKATPRIEIPDFYGNYTQWSSFKDLFVESIHSNPLLAKTQKMQHLKSKLKGEAEKLVQHLNVSAENYDACWDILTHRYDNQRLLFTSYMNTMLNQPTIQHNNAYSIKKLHDTTVECLNGLTNLGLELSASHSILAHLICKKLDSEIYAEYVKGLKAPRELPNLEELLNFLESKFIALETLQNGQNPRSSAASSHVPNQKYDSQKKPTLYNRSEKAHKTYNFTFSLQRCPLCKHNGHVLMQCDKFFNMTCDARRSAVAKLQFCKNCLYSHNNKACNSDKRCKLCNKAHHTLLHENNSETSTSQNKPPAVNSITDENREILLTTVQLKVKNIHGNYVTLRALLDQGSQVSLITEDSAQLLQLPRKKMSAVVSGVGSISGNSKGLLQLECKSIHSKYTFKTETLIMNKLTKKLPATSFSVDNWNYLNNIKLADPEFNISGPVNLLLGADVYSELIMDGVMKSEKNLPIAQQTKLGWILCGNVQTFNCFITLNELENITHFWETEDINQNNRCVELNEEEYCEKYYTNTTERQNDGKYIVKMPMKPDFEKYLGDSKPQAMSQFFQLERKMQRQKNFAAQYKLFMKEYKEMGHMKPVTTKTENQPQTYLPHHGVLRNDSTTTKLRVVFNGSQKAKNNYSLNDLMHTGPNLQKDIMSLVSQWRLHQYAFTADMEKMYRNILLHEDQQPLQKIIWRDTPKEPLREMQLCTVTYGTKAAPYLAMRTLQQLAQDDGHKYPEAAKVLSSYCYMDDLLYGSNTIESAKNLIQDLILLAKGGGLNLRKWTTNEPLILQNLTEEQKSKTVLNFKQENSEKTKTLGLNWNPQDDYFYFDFKQPPSQKHTKRTLLSEISCLYDPLGWLSPVIIKTKLLFQKLWLDNYSWDETVPEEIYKEWEKIRKDLENIQTLKLNRWLSTSGDEIELHGFCDASEKAYAAVVYCRAQNKNEIKITLVAAKTKVAPIKTKITLPQLELCGALLLAKLLEKLNNTYKEKQITYHCWTDSKVVLAWLQRDVNKSERYIANRVKQIRAIIPVTQWSYVKSEENSADCATRGLLPSKLMTFNLWWEGPLWLKTYKGSESPDKKQSFVTEFGMISNCCFATKNNQNNNTIFNALLMKCSSLTRAIRLVSWILRFVAATRNKILICTNYLSKHETSAATLLFVKNVQEQYYQQEIELLKKTETIRKGPLSKLSPILDETGLLRVGGRLQNSTLPYETKHPLILPPSKLTELIIDYYHKLTLHGGPRLTLALIREKYWIVGGNKTVKKQLRLCVWCARFKSHQNQQIMGELPKARITPSRPFTNTGVDYTGHVELKINKGKGVRTCKGYIAIFICMVTKAVHLELVSDLSTEAFLAALKRMCSRRGRPKNMYSDNGTNFVGAVKVLKEDFKYHKTFSSQEFYDAVNELDIEWHFNAPLWPTAGGLWEAAVKSMKYHLRRVIGEQKLTYEQFSTLLTQVEACMNSRPLCALTEDIEDLDYLTPGHFLTGRPILSIPYGSDVHDGNLDLRNRWKLVDQMNLHLWKRWSQEYLQQLQIRSKWQTPSKNLETGDIVLLKENNLPPGKWALGRVTELHPGADGYVRVVTLKTKNSNLKRPITKLARLPIEEKTATSDENSSQAGTKQRKNSINKGCFAVLMTLLFFFVAPAKSTHLPQPSYKINTIENQPIYFDEIGKIQLIHDDWSLLIYYNLTSYWNSMIRIQKNVEHIQEICTTVKSAPCDAIANQLRHELGYLLERNDLLLTTPKLRRKRGYFNGVGNLARTLFGTLDENFAIKYEKDIENLKSNDNYLKHLIKNQTLIIEAENNIVKRNEKFINDQFEIMHNYMNETRYELQQLETRVGMLFVMNDVNAMSLTASLILANLHRTQEMLLNALADVHNGHLDMHLFSAEQLIQQLHIISGKLPKGLSLPITDSQQEITELYKLLHVKARITKNYFLFELHIPLVSDENYNIYRVIPVPFKKEEHWHMIATITSYIAINFAKNSYLSLQEQELQSCTLYNKDNYICSLQQPIYKLHNQDAPCEIKVFNQQRSLSCTINEIACSDNWVKLHMSNIWLFTCCDKHLLRIICSDQVTSAAITGTGLIALQEGCAIQKEDATIYSFNHFGSDYNLKTNDDVSTLDSSINKIMNITWHNTQLKIDFKRLNNSEDFAKIQQSLIEQKLKEQESLPSETDTLSLHDVFHYSFSCVAAGGAAVCIIYFVIKKRNIREANTASVQQEVTANQPLEIELQEMNTVPAQQPQSSEITFDFN